MLRRLFIDIETCPNVGLFWRPGPKVSIDHKSILFPARIITSAYKWAGENKVRALVWTPSKEQFKESDEELIKDQVSVMAEADEIVAHFGDGFDIPWIRGRALKHGVITPILKTIDTCAWSRKLFLLPSNKLDFLADYLGFGGKIRTDYDLWKDITFKKDKGALHRMVDYNKHDVVLLEKVFGRLELYGSPKTHVGVMEGKEKWTCVRCGNDKVKHIRHMVSATGTVKHQMRCRSKDCGKYYMISQSTYESWR